MAVTSKDIANICGVSQGTVDRAFNNRPGISHKTKEIILETANKLGYRPSLLARSLVKGKSMTIGLIVFDLHNRFFSELVNTIELSARQQGYFVYLTLTGKSKDDEKSCIEHLTSRQVDGMILCSVNHGKEYEEYLRHFNTPIITIGNRISDAFTFVGIDDYSAMREATTNILNKGYTRIVYISPPLSNMHKTNLYAPEQRLNGYHAALNEFRNGLQPIVFGASDYINRIESLDFKNGEKTAILCSSDIYALEVLRHLRIKDVKIPEDVGLMGFDNIDMLKYIQPSLSSIAYPLKELGTKAMECLINQINGNIKVGDVLISHRIVQGCTL